MSSDHIEGEIGRGPIAYLRARREGRIVYAKPGGWLRWRADLARLRVLGVLETDEERRDRRELVEFRRGRR